MGSPTKNQAYLSNITEKKRIIEQKLQEASTKGQKPGVSAIAQGFQPSRDSLGTQVNHQSFSFSIPHSFSFL